MYKKENKDEQTSNQPFSHVKTRKENLFSHVLWPFNHYVKTTKENLYDLTIQPLCENYKREPIITCTLTMTTHRQTRCKDKIPSINQIVYSLCLSCNGISKIVKYFKHTGTEIWTTKLDYNLESAGKVHSDQSIYKVQTKDLWDNVKHSASDARNV